MTIYFVTAREIGRVKIGVSENPYLRFSKMQSDSPVQLALERIADGGFPEEQALHARFSEHRVSGEWFALADMIEAHMSELEVPMARTGTAMRFADTDIGALRGRLGLTLAEFGARLQLKSAGEVSMIERGLRPISAMTALRIEALSEGRIDAAGLNDDVRAARHGVDNALPDACPATGQPCPVSGEVAA